VRGRQFHLELDAAMHFFAYSILVTAMVVVLVECGYALYYLLLLI
jgi:hypothetical protein